MKRSAAIGFAVVLAFGVFIVLFRISEPRYQGRTLTTWLQQYSDASMDETQRLAEARSAVLAIGAKRALPKILNLALTQDDPVSTWMTDKTEKFRIGFFHWRSTIDSQLMGFAGFEILGTNAAPAVPELTRLLQDTNQAIPAARCLENIGKPAEDALCRCLTNANPAVRRLGISGLASATDDVEVYLARIKRSLKDSDSYVRFTAVLAICEQDNAPDLAIPLLIATTEDTDDNVASRAVGGLKESGTNAASTFPVLTNLINSSKLASARAALSAIVKIAPESAVFVLSNAIVNGKPEILRVALQNLKAVSPDLALQMTLDELHSSDTRRRLQAIGMASEYEPSTAGIADALKSAARDDDPQISQRASTVMRDMVQRQEQNPNADVQIPKEPSYEGKSLGEWLKAAQDGSGLSTNAVDALRQMGTNAIPALLARLTYKDPVFGIPRYDISMSGVSGLIALGDRAVPALPALATVMDGDDQDLAIRAMMATLGTGTNALPCLVRGLASRHPDVRHEAANTLSDWGAQFPKGRESAVFLLRNLLTDPDPEIRRNATNQLTALESPPTSSAKIK
jgi:HEAT repeat protein